MFWKKNFINNLYDRNNKKYNFMNVEYKNILLKMKNWYYDIFIKKYENSIFKTFIILKLKDS